MSRKYRHQGYQDSDVERPSKPARTEQQNLTPEERIQRRSLRHATQREANEVIRCHHCGRDVPAMAAITVETSCPHCRARLHCCRTCNHFDSSARWQCRAEIAAPVHDKSGANRCAHYRPRLVLDTTGRRSQATNGGASNDPRVQFENLFKK